MEAMRRLGKVHNIESIMRAPVGCMEQYRYRNKMTFKLSTNKEALMRGARSELEEQPLVGKCAYMLLIKGQ